MGKNRRRAVFTWLYVCPLLVLCGILGFLQYRLIGQVRDAARDRLRGSLQASLTRVSQEFESEIATATAQIVPNPIADPATAEQDLRARFMQWKQTSRHSQLFARITMAVPQGATVVLRPIEPADVPADGAWPPSFEALKLRMEYALKQWSQPGPGGSPPPPPEQTAPHELDSLAMEVPMFPAPSPRPAQGPFGRHEIAWVVLELNASYVRSTMLPGILQRHLGAGGNLDYLVEVVNRTNPDTVVYESDPGESHGVIRNADASVGIFDPQTDQFFRRNGPGGRGRGRGPGPGGPGGRGGPGPDEGRWTMYVRHRAGSLEVVAAHARMLNLSVTGGVLLLMVATLAALIRYTRRAQQLAELQMEFVAGVSHELRTPLTVIHTAAYNLRGKLSTNPTQVERYGALIQQESGRLKDLVEQVLEFSHANAGLIIQDRRPLSVEALIEQALEAEKTSIAGAQCVVERAIQPDLPAVTGDALALRRAIANLVGNAAKYGSGESHWIGITASAAADNGKSSIRIAVADRGPGIPAEEQEHIFEPFFRGARAVQNQIHGTGLGLSLVKKIVEAHGGSVRVKSAPTKGAEFILTLPATPEEVTE